MAVMHISTLRHASNTGLRRSTARVPKPGRDRHVSDTHLPAKVLSQKQYGKIENYH